jgi:glycosyltransferase involved in cell wall biosynthesis
MTALSDAERSRAAVLSRLDAAWRARAVDAQLAVLPAGRIAVSCPAPFGTGGLGRHLEEIADAIGAVGEQPAACMCEGGGAPPRDCRAVQRGVRWRLQDAIARPFVARRVASASEGFDAAAARSLPPAEHLIAFNGAAWAQFAAARKARFASLSLMSANPHMRYVTRQHAAAHSSYPLEPQWATRLLERNLREYDAADRIFVTSRYSWRSFVEEGIPADRLSMFPLTPSPRFQVEPAPAPSSHFEVLYVGALTVHKGVPLLIEAVGGLPFSDLRVVLVGGWKTRGMRRFLQRAIADDARISVRPGDPLPRLRQARLYVHPAYEDGFAYAPAEALACAVPLLVSEDTGMKELIGSAREGLVLPTGDVGALREAIAAAYRGEIFNA